MGRYQEGGGAMHVFLRDIIEEKDLKVTKVKKTEEGCKHCGSSRVWRNGRDKERKKAGRFILL